MAMNKKGSGADDHIEAIDALVTDVAAILVSIADIKAKYDAHRHNTAGAAAAANTGPSTGAGTSEATQSSMAATPTATATSD